jgi:hypothetical protein
VVMIVWYLDLQLHTQSVSITTGTNVVSLNPAQGEVCLIPHYVIKCVGDLQHGRWFSPVSSTNITNRHVVTENSSM